MLSANIPHLYTRNGIYYYRNNSHWKSLRTRYKKEAFKKLSFTMFDTTQALNDTVLACKSIAVTTQNTKLPPYYSIVILPSTSELIKFI